MFTMYSSFVRCVVYVGRVGFISFRFDVALRRLYFILARADTAVELIKDSFTDDLPPMKLGFHDNGGSWTLLPRTPCKFPTKAIEKARLVNSFCTSRITVAGLKSLKTEVIKAWLKSLETKVTIACFKSLETEVTIAWLKSLETGVTIARLKSLETKVTIACLKSLETGVTIAWLKSLETGVTIAWLKSLETGVTIAWLKSLGTDTSFSTSLLTRLC